MATGLTPSCPCPSASNTRQITFVRHIIWLNLSHTLTHSDCLSAKLPKNFVITDSIFLSSIYTFQQSKAGRQGRGMLSRRPFSKPFSTGYHKINLQFVSFLLHMLLSFRSAFHSMAKLNASLVEKSRCATLVSILSVSVPAVGLF